MKVLVTVMFGAIVTGCGSPDPMAGPDAGATDGDVDGDADGDSDAGTDSGVAEERDECALGLDDCPEVHGICKDTREGYWCSCDSGWYLSGDGTSCQEEIAVRQVSATDQRTCVVLADGRPACWGATGAWAPPETAPPNRPVKYIAAGDLMTCAIEMDDTVTCWGAIYNEEMEPPEGERFAKVSCGYRHACGIRLDGSLSCWGEDNDGNTVPPEGNYYTDVVVEGFFSCALRENKQAVCWGDNFWGAANPPYYEFDQIALATFHGCGVKTDGTIRCWGEGLETLDQLCNPPDGDFLRVGVGVHSSCGINADGEIVCWVNDTMPSSDYPKGPYDQISISDSHGCAKRPGGGLHCWPRTDWWPSAGAAVPPEGFFTSVSVSPYHACGLRHDGTIQCFGACLDDACDVPAGSFSQVAAGGLHTCALRRDDSKAECWGGDTLAQRTAPDVPFAQLSAGGGLIADDPNLDPWATSFTCGVTLDGVLRCWGDDDVGQLDHPDGTYTQVATGFAQACAVRTDQGIDCWGHYYQQLTIEGAFTQASCSYSHCCGLKTDGTVSCWAPLSSLEAPEGVFLQLAAVGSDHTCGIREDSTVDCWGKDGKPSDDVVAPRGEFLQIASRGGICGIREDETLVCWGGITRGLWEDDFE